MAGILLKNITKRYPDGTVAVNDVNLDIKNKEFIILVGPSGCGKSTVIKMIMDDLDSGIKATADIGNESSGDIMKSREARKRFTKRTCSVKQADEFEASHLLDCCLTSLISIPAIHEPVRYILDFVTKHRFYTVCYSDAEHIKLGIRDGYSRRLLAKCGIDPTEATQEDIKAALFLAKNPERMSGGQKKIANILSALVRCEYSDLLIIDEPLNALDYDNVRLFSNIINRIHLEQPNVGIIIVTHCRAMPCLNRILTIANNTITEDNTEIFCNSCFGEMDTNGYYI